MSNLGDKEIINLALNTEGVSVVVNGKWLIENDLDVEWIKKRNLKQMASNFKEKGLGELKGFVDGKITNEFKDYITIYQAKTIGLI